MPASSPSTKAAARPRWSRRRLAAVAGAALTAIGAGAIGGCVRVSGGTWAVRSAPLPEGWPEMTPVGEVELRSYPAYREARVDGGEAGGDGGVRPMFGALFEHISGRDIPMTAPVDMGYTSDDAGGVRMGQMSFLYRTADAGDAAGEMAKGGAAAGPVRVIDRAPSQWLSTGVRGAYTDARFAAGRERLLAWIGEHPQWRAAGAPRYLGYNGPFTLWFLRYGEVQIPVESDGAVSDGDERGVKPEA